MLRFLFIVLLLFINNSCSDEQEAKKTDDAKQEQISKIDNGEAKKRKQQVKEKSGVKSKKKQSKKKKTTKKKKKITPAIVRDLKIWPDDMVIGDINAKVVLVEYFAPTCPHCYSYHKRTLPKIKEKYVDTGKIAYVFREFVATKQDLDATVLARCNGDVEGYLKFIEIMLQTQRNWVFSKNYREILTNMGQVGGVSGENYAKCLNDKKMVEVLMANTRLPGKFPKFIGTPAFFINGDIFTKPYTFEELSKAIDSYLDKK
ncbi:MAG: thioredoxin domain-containing protein [Rickettsiaceae bacterium]|nr:thioredoxin domain-containing protein [Rickettsiaceae bacterium]